MKKETLTYSSLDLFRNCRSAYQKKFELGIHPIQKAWNLVFGGAVHEVLQVWHTDYNLHALKEKIDSLYPQRGFDPEEKKDWLLLNGMMKGYTFRYLLEDFEALCLEKKFTVDIINPETRAKSKTFELSGKVDGVVKMKETGEYFLIEHKTAGTIDGGYLEKLWTDFQLRLYVPAIEKELGITLTGIIYNILGKTAIRQRQGETEAEYEARKAEAEATILARANAKVPGFESIKPKKQRPVKLKRKMPETDEEFLDRLDEFYRKPEAFHREIILINREAEKLLQAEVWELTQNILQARRSGMWYQNSSYCFHWNRACPYYPLCRSNGKHQFLLESGVDYEIRKPHEELQEEPAF